MITGSGRRTAESFNGDAAGAALLEVTFTEVLLDDVSITDDNGG